MTRSLDEHKKFLFEVYKGLGDVLGGRNAVSDPGLKESTNELKKAVKQRLSAVFDCRTVFHSQVKTLEDNMAEIQR